MTVTPQTNTTLQAIAQALLEHDDIVICGHVSPDGDCIGSQLALMHGLRAVGKRVTCVLAEECAIDEGLKYLPGCEELVLASEFGDEVQVFVGVDVPTVERIGEAAALHQKAQLTITVDHHAVDTPMSDMVYVDPDAAATALLVWELLEHLVPQRTQAMAQCAYTGLLTDTGRFLNQNTNAESFHSAVSMVECGADVALAGREVYQNRTLASVRLEALAVERMRLIANGAAAVSWIDLDDYERLGAQKGDAEPLVNTLRSIKGVRVACMLRGRGETVRGSLRAKDDTDISVLARRYGGGGHKAAAGFTLEMDMEQAVETTVSAIEQLLDNPSAFEGEAQ